MSGKYLVFILLLLFSCKLWEFDEARVPSKEDTETFYLYNETPDTLYNFKIIMISSPEKLDSCLVSQLMPTEVTKTKIDSKKTSFQDGVFNLSFSSKTEGFNYHGLGYYSRGVLNGEDRKIYVTKVNGRYKVEAFPFYYIKE